MDNPDNRIALINDIQRYAVYLGEDNRTELRYTYRIVSYSYHNNNRYIRMDTNYERSKSYAFIQWMRRGVRECDEAFPTYFVHFDRALYLLKYKTYVRNRFSREVWNNGFHVFFEDINEFCSALYATLICDNGSQIHKSKTIDEVIPTYSESLRQLLVGRKIGRITKTNNIVGERCSSRFGKWFGFGRVYDIYHKSIMNYRWNPSSKEKHIGIYLNSNVRLVMVEELKEMPAKVVPKYYTIADRNEYNHKRIDPQTYSVCHTRTLYLSGTFIVLESNGQKMCIAFAKYLWNYSQSMSDFTRCPHNRNMFEQPLPANTDTDFIIELNAVTPDRYSSLCWGLIEMNVTRNHNHFAKRESFMLVIPDGDIAPLKMIEFNQNNIDRIIGMQRQPLDTAIGSPISGYVRCERRQPIRIDRTDLLSFGLLSYTQWIRYPYRQHQYAFINTVLFRAIDYYYRNTIYESVMTEFSDYVRRECLPEKFRDYRDPNGESIDEFDGVTYLVYKRANNRTEYVSVLTTSEHSDYIIENLMR